MVHANKIILNNVNDEKYSNKVKERTIRLVEKKGFHEYYSCKNGKPMGANNFSWSAALYLDLINN